MASIKGSDRIVEVHRNLPGVQDPTLRILSRFFFFFSFRFVSFFFFSVYSQDIGGKTCEMIWSVVLKECEIEPDSGDGLVEGGGGVGC